MSTFGTLFRVTTFGESHCKGVGAIVDGVPPNMEISEKDIQVQLDRRRPGQSQLTTPRAEADKVTILSGTEFGRTLGTPVGLVVYNEDARPKDYSEMASIPRPGHADYTYLKKYNVRASSGGGRSSARETIGRVAAGAIAEKWLKENYKTEIVSFVSSIGNVELPRDHQRHPTGRGWKRDEVDHFGTLVLLPYFEVSDPALSSESVFIEKLRESAIFSSTPSLSDPYYLPPTLHFAGSFDENVDFPAYLTLDGLVLSQRGAIIPDSSSKYPAASLESARKKAQDLVYIRCPHAPTAALMASLIRLVKSESDSVGGTVLTEVRNVPVGLGEPCFDKMEARLAQAMLSLPATKGFEMGLGFRGCALRGSQTNDVFKKASSLPRNVSEPVIDKRKRPLESTDSVPNAQDDVFLLPVTNSAGGTLGGISSGADITFRVAVKAVSTIGKAQNTVDFNGKEAILKAKGRHDPCVLPRTPPLTESMCALVLIDLCLVQRSRGPLTVPFAQDSQLSDEESS